jgi:transcriptional regulator with XRE-family HTH domain
MNIEIANRLVDLRKKSGLSQEELAAKLGLSRQAVSKWERAEASPDTDNLICLAKLYGVSLDTLLNTDQSIDEIVKEQVKSDAAPASEATSSSAEAASSSSNEGAAKASQSEAPHPEQTESEQVKDGDEVHIDETGVHFKSGADAGSIDHNGIHIESKDGGSVHIDMSGIHVKDASGKVHEGNGTFKMDVVSSNAKREKHYHTIQAIASGVTVFLCVIAYLLLGFLLPDSYLGWGCSWIVFFLIPLVPSAVEALHKRSFTTFAYPVLVTAVYLLLGMVWGYWHPWWVLFISIPLYYILFEPIDKVIRDHRIKTGAADIKIQTDVDDEDSEDEKDDDDVIDVDVK